MHATVKLVGTERPMYRELELLVPFIGRTVKLRMYGNAERARRPALIYLHGGYFNSGRIEDADAIAREMRGTAAVICVAYPLAPASPFPAALETGYTVLQWAACNAVALGIDRANLFVGGDRAGGTIAAAIAMIARDRHFNRGRGVRLAGQVLITPLLDPAQATAALRGTRQHPCLRAWPDYLSRPGDFNHPYASPLRSRRLAGLAPVLLISTGSDPMRDEASLYAQRLNDAHVPVSIQVLEAASVIPVNPLDPAFDRTAALLESFIKDLAKT